MSKETLAFVSSYNDLCGNASYTKVLADALSREFVVTVLPLNTQLLREKKGAKANSHIRSLCKQLQSFDCVNIQFEAGLFGSDLRLMKKNFFAIAKAAKKLVITMHRYQCKDPYPGLTAFGKYLVAGQISHFFTDAKKTFANNRYAGIFRDVVSFCKSNNIPIIVHTKRDKELIELGFNYRNIFDHPLSFYEQSAIESIKNSYSRKDFCRFFSLDENKKYVGIFGFINKYKGHETAIKAMEHLPDNYELLIFGTQHPHSIKTEEPINNYINQLLQLIKDLKLTQRVKFFRLPNDDDFLKALLRCDYNILPYLEVKQGGSAIASLALETNSNTIFSQNFAFFELEKYAENCFPMFTIGNYLELANAILSYQPENYSQGLSKYHGKYNLSSSVTLYSNLLKKV